MSVSDIGYKDANCSPDQVTLVGSFDTNDTGVPNGCRGRVSVSRTGAGVFKVEMLADPTMPAATFDRFDCIVLQPESGGVTDPNLYVYRVTARDATLVRPTFTITQYIRTYAAGAIDTYAAGDSTDIKLNFYAVMHKTDALAR